MTLIVGADCETTGISFEKGHRIIEIALIGYDFDTEKEIFRYEKRINPGRSIDPKAQLVHKISQADLVGKPAFAEVEPIVTKILTKADLFVAHNLTFDAGFLIGEYGLLRKPLPDVQGFDTMAEGRWATSVGKNPNLRELCYACNVEYNSEEAHQATYDVVKMMECFFYAAKRGGFNVKGLLK